MITAMVKFTRYYHVYNRGVKKIPLFLREQDYKVFISRAGKYSTELQVSVLGFVVIPNHFHLQLALSVAKSTTNHAAGLILGKFMHRLATSYGMYFNKIYRASGHVFQGTYNCKRTMTNRHIKILSRYIHRNPAELARNATESERIEYIRNYKWSSYRYYLGIEAPPKWLNRSLVLRRFGHSIKEYQTFVEKSDTKFRREVKYRHKLMGFSDQSRQIFQTPKKARRVSVKFWRQG